MFYKGDIRILESSLDLKEGSSQEQIAEGTVEEVCIYVYVKNLIIFVLHKEQCPYQKPQVAK